MTDFADQALLPAGMSDELPPEASIEANALERLILIFTGFGYQRIKPPLIEFEESLLSGLGTGMGSQTFRLMDPVSHRMMGVRADMTPQVARIAATRLKKAPRPLRLSYAGQVLRVKGSQLRPERQFTQVGAELIGRPETEADVEVILMGWEALRDLGVSNLSVDLYMPTLVPAVCEDFNISEDTRDQLRQGLNIKDAAKLTSLSGELGQPATTVLSAMLASAGSADKTLKALHSLKLGTEASKVRGELSKVVERLKQDNPDINVTIDPVENRGFEYHTGVTFTYFARNVRGELGNGGRYQISISSQASEPSTGFTLFMDTVLRAIPATPSTARIYLPAQTPRSVAAALRREGWATVDGLVKVDNLADEARRLQCSHLLEDGEPSKLQD